MKRSMSEILKQFRAFWWGDRGLSTLLILLLPAMFIVPLLDSDLARFLFAVLFSALLVSGVTNISSRRLPRFAAAALSGSTIAILWLNELHPVPALTAWAVFLSLLCFLLLAMVILRQVFMDGPVTVTRIKGAMAVYILIGFSWSYIYQLIDLQIPGAFNLPHSTTAPNDIRHSADLTYFSFVTLTTLGYGDITAVHPISRMFVIIEALIGQLYPATLLARLVSLEIMHREKQHADTT
jgi:hypothetical protein